MLLERQKIDGDPVRPDSTVPTAPTPCFRAQCLLVPAKKLISKMRSRDGKFSEPRPLSASTLKRVPKPSPLNSSLTGLCRVIVRELMFQKTIKKLLLLSIFSESDDYR